MTSALPFFVERTPWDVSSLGTPAPEDFNLDYVPGEVHGVQITELSTSLAERDHQWVRTPVGITHNGHRISFSDGADGFNEISLATSLLPPDCGIIRVPFGTADGCCVAIPEVNPSIGKSCDLTADISNGFENLYTLQEFQSDLVGTIYRGHAHICQVTSDDAPGDDGRGAPRGLHKFSSSIHWRALSPSIRTRCGVCYSVSGCYLSRLRRPIFERPLRGEDEWMIFI